MPARKKENTEAGDRSAPWAILIAKGKNPDNTPQPFLFGGEEGEQVGVDPAPVTPEFPAMHYYACPASVKTRDAALKWYMEAHPDGVKENIQAVQLKGKMVSLTVETKQVLSIKEA